MSIMDGDGHLTSTELGNAPMAYYLLGNSRISITEDRIGWGAFLSGLGAVEVDRETYERADALRDGEHE